jgi:hypothetical protein
MEVIRDFAALPGWDPRVIPILESVVAAPLFLPDGRLIQTRGYHAEVRVFYAPPPGLDIGDIPDVPTPGQIAEALQLIFGELLFDFPFADQASKANALACMLLPFVRPMIAGATPLHLFEGSTPGTGKGKLARMCAFPSLGPGLHSTPQKESDAEWRKALTSALMSGSTHTFIDNMFMRVRWTRDGISPSLSTRPPWLRP